MDITPLTDKINLIVGAITAFMAYLLGEHWIFFAFYLGLNFGDVITRWIAARLTGTESSRAASVGILKKLGYWIMIVLGFGMGIIFIEIGTFIGMKLEFTMYIGWFTLLTLIINEIRSILENLIEAGYNPPNVLTKGLEIVNKAIDGTIKIGDDGIETTFHKTEEEIKTKGKAVLHVEDIRTKISEDKGE